MLITLLAKHPIDWRTEMEVKVYLAHEQFELLQLLAREGGETVQQLMLRLILKEDFERHVSYDAMRGMFSYHRCYMNCFLQGGNTRETQKMSAIPVTRKLQRHD
jgi:hypothetical protein